MSHIPRNLEYLNRRHIVYRRDPITDRPSMKHKDYNFYEDGTYECYQLFRSKAKITTYKSLKWHMLVLWYLNPDWEKDDAIDIAMYIADKPNGFTTFNMNKWNVERVINDLYLMDLEEQPRNKLRKIVFKPNCGLTKSEKLSIVGKLIGRLNGIKKEDIYDSMLLLNDSDEKITIAKLAKSLKCTPRTIHRHMCNKLKQEKENLNNEI